MRNKYQNVIGNCLCLIVFLNGFVFAQTIEKYEAHPTKLQNPITAAYLKKNISFYFFKNFI